MRDSSARPVDLWHRVTMRALRILGLLAAAASSSACFQMTTALKVNADGSGTIEHRMVYTTAGLARLRQFASLGDGRSVDPLSEQQAREMTASIGPGVTYVSSELITSPAGTGRATTYAFTDVSTLQDFDAAGGAWRVDDPLAGPQHRIREDHLLAVPRRRAATRCCRSTSPSRTSSAPSARPTPLPRSG